MLQEIRKAYRQCVLKYHPDKISQQATEEKVLIPKPEPCKVTPAIPHGVVSYSGRDCVKSLRSSYTGLYPQKPRTPLPRRTRNPNPRTPSSSSLLLSSLELSDTKVYEP